MIKMSALYLPQDCSGGVTLIFVSAIQRPSGDPVGVVSSISASRQPCAMLHRSTL
jgi:hypothetical protein